MITDVPDIWMTLKRLIFFDAVWCFELNLTPVDLGGLIECQIKPETSDNEMSDEFGVSW